MTISGGSALSKDEIDRMMRDAESHAEEDRKRREEVDVLNSAEALVFQTEKFLADNAESIPADAKANVDEPLAELKRAIEAKDTPAMKSATERLATASQALGAAMYSANQAAGASASAGASGASSDDDDVVDAEIVDEGDSK